MPTLILEPRDAGVLDVEDLTVDFEEELTALLHGAQACGNTCKRGICTFTPCCVSIMVTPGE
jgi:hypothetical protein